MAVDGISLTVADCDRDGVGFWIAVIPHTYVNTTLVDRRAGDVVNLEADLLAKYTERLLAARLDPGGQAELKDGGSMAQPFSDGWLQEHGWAG